jgi:sugar phosphate isomerase/epimerase
MKIGFLTACLPKLKLEELANWASEEGFQALELAAWPAKSSRDYQGRQINAATLNEDGAKKIKDIIAKNGLCISSLAYYDNNLHPNLNKRTRFHDHLKKVIDAAALLEVNLVGTFVGGRADKDPEKNIKEIGEIFRNILSYAEDKGVRIMIENCPMEGWMKFGVPGNYAYSPELWNALFNEVPSNNFGLNLDPSHLLWLGIDYIRVIKDFSARIFHTHAKDTEILEEGKYQYGIFSRQLEHIPWKSGWWRYRIPGLGQINWKAFIQTLQHNGYDQVISIEHEDPIWEGSEEKVKEGLKLGYKHLFQFTQGS